MASKFVHSALVGAAVMASALTLIQQGRAWSELPHELDGSQAPVYDGCDLEGSKASTAEIDKLKNRYEVIAKHDTSLTFVKLANAKWTQNWSQNIEVTLEAYLVGIHRTNKETCNCESTNPDDWDWHGYLGAKPDSPLSECVIFEVTPRMRFWNLTTLKANIGKPIRVTGALFNDIEHRANSTADDGKGKLWRASCWEIHPVWKVEVED